MVSVSVLTPHARATFDRGIIQLFGGETNGLSSGKNSRDNVGREESERDQVSHIAMGDPFGLGDLRERSGPTARELLEPLPSTYDRFDEGRVDTMAFRWRVDERGVVPL